MIPVATDINQLIPLSTIKQFLKFSPEIQFNQLDISQIMILRTKINQVYEEKQENQRQKAFTNKMLSLKFHRIKYRIIELIQYERSKYICDQQDKSISILKIVGIIIALLIGFYFLYQKIYSIDKIDEKNGVTINVFIDNNNISYILLVVGVISIIFGCYGFCFCGWRGIYGVRIRCLEINNKAIERLKQNSYVY